MRFTKTIILLVIITLSANALYSQNQSIMQFTLKNGNKINGTITDNNNGSITIRTLDGSIFVVENTSIKNSIVIIAKTTTNKVAVEKIYLTNGSIINGEVLSSSSNSVKVRSMDGTVWEFNSADVNKIIKNATNTASKNNKTSKWENQFSIGGGISFDNDNVAQQEFKYRISYFIIPSFTVGVGLKSDLYFQSKNTVHLISPLASLSVKPWTNKKSYPSLSADIGYGFYSSFSESVGIYFNPYISSTIYRSKNLEIGLSAGYKYQNVNKENKAINSLTFGVNIIF